MVTASHTLSPGDRHEIVAAARRFFAAGLWCAVETERPPTDPAAGASWEPRLLVFGSGTPAKVLGAVEDVLARPLDGRVRLTAYSPSRLAPTPLPASVVCSPAPSLGGVDFQRCLPTVPG